MNEPLDRRSRKTRKALMAAFIHLCSIKPYSELQVLDITENADVGYATFYRHFESKDHLMLAVITVIMTELESSIQAGEGRYFENEGRGIFTHVQSHYKLYRNLLQSTVFTKRIRKHLAGLVQKQVQGHSLPESRMSFSVELAGNHISAALIGLIEWWVENKMRLPVEEMARIYERLVIQSTFYAMDQANNLSIHWHHY